MALDYDSGRKQFARVARVLVHYPRGDRFTAFETRARIEIGALTAAVEVSVAVGASTVDVDAWRGLCSTCGAL